MSDKEKKDENKEAIYFEGEESKMIYEFDGDEKLGIFSPDYKSKVGMMTFSRPVDLKDLQKAIKNCEEEYLKEIGQ